MLRVIYTGGTFDLFHSGHVELLRKRREVAGNDGHVIVAVNRDEFVARYKRKPVMSLEERLACVRAVRYVDAAIVNIGDKDSTLSISATHPTHIAIGDDWKDRDYYKQMGYTKTWIDTYYLFFCVLRITKEMKHRASRRPRSPCLNQNTPLRHELRC